MAGTNAGLWKIPIEYLLNTTSIQPTPELPDEFILEQNYPNPFNPTTTIKYSISSGVETRQLARQLTGGASLQHVTLKIHDILGNEVATLVNETKEPGVHEVEFDGSKLSSGVYFYRLHAGEFSRTRKMILVK
ncbi:MAG: T9SS type A sorting domain-containing protein [bacterium]